MTMANMAQYCGVSHWTEVSMVRYRLHCPAVVQMPEVQENQREMASTVGTLVTLYGPRPPCGLRGGGGQCHRPHLQRKDQGVWPAQGENPNEVEIHPKAEGWGVGSWG